jgi:hypothetical protein
VVFINTNNTDNHATNLMLKKIFTFKFSGSDDDDVVIAAFKSFDDDGKIDSER